MRSWRRICGLAALLLVGFAGCCKERPLRVNDMESRLNFGFEWAAKVKFDASARFDFNWDFAAWAKFSAASQFTLDFDFGQLPAYRRKLQADLDNDGVLEEVDLLAFGVDPSSPERVLVSWQGDAYTFDADRCYVMWWQGNTLQLINGRCHSPEPALHCEMTKGKAETFSCNVCQGSGDCAQCAAAEVSDCVSDGQSRLAHPPASGGAGTAGSSAFGGAGNANGGTGGTGGAPGGAGAAGTAFAGGGIAGGTTFPVTVATGGTTASPVATTIAVSVEFDTCLTQVRSLAGDANGCGRGPLIDANTLCSSRLSDVNICYVAVQGAGLFSSECSVLGSDVCRGVFP